MLQWSNNSIKNYISSFEEFYAAKQYNEAIEIAKNIIQVCLRIPDYALLKEYYK